jgi:hypothetical protein
MSKTGAIVLKKLLTNRLINSIFMTVNVKPNIARKRRRKNPRVVTAAQAAEMLRLSRSAILWNISHGYLKARFNGYKYLIRLDDIEKFEEEFYL